MRKSRKVWKWMIGILVVLAVAAVVVLSLLQRTTPQYTEEIAKTQDIITYYTFSGNLEPGDAQVVVARSRGTVKELLKDEGDTVEDEEDVIQPKSGSKIESTMAGTISNMYVKVDDDYTPGTELFRLWIFRVTVEGIRRNAMLVDGHLVDEYYMARLL